MRSKDSKFPSPTNLTLDRLREGGNREAPNNIIPTVKINNSIDHQLLFIAVCLTAFGLVMVYSNGNLSRFYWQVFACLLGGAGMWVVSLIPFQIYQKYAYHLLIGTIIALILVFTPLGYRVGSAERKFYRWIQISGVHFQPAELAKLGLVIYTARFLVAKRQHIHSLRRGVFPSILVLAIVFTLLYIQPDFGSAVLISAVVLGLLFIGGARLTQILLVMGSAGVLIYGWVQDDTYKMQRITEYLRSLKSPFDTHYQVEQSLNAIASGGLFGTGIGNSVHKLGRLPHADTDFVFAVVAEELGLFGAMGLVFLYILLVWRGIQIVLQVSSSQGEHKESAPTQSTNVVGETKFASLVAFGITAQIGLQAFINIGVALGALPTKGITLPFISYGGSSLLMSLISIGILLNISRFRQTGLFDRTGYTH